MQVDPCRRVPSGEGPRLALRQAEAGERMGGAFHVWNLAGGSEVDYNFHATKVSDTP